MQRHQHTEYQVVYDDNHGNEVLTGLTSRDAMRYIGADGVQEVRKVVWRETGDTATRDDVVIWGGYARMPESKRAREAFEKRTAR